MLQAELKDKNVQYCWRYMDFDRYVSLLLNKTMYFSALSSYTDDQFEAMCDILKLLYETNSSHKDLNTLYNFYKNSEYSRHNDCSYFSSENKRKSLAILFKRFSDSTVVNCWHKNNSQSAAMWNLYSNNVKTAVAIMVPLDNLKSYANIYGMDFKDIKYINYNDNLPTLYDAATYKRKVYEHEKEIRLIKTINNYGKHIIDKNGLVISTGGVCHHYPFDFNKMVDAVIVSPYAEKYFAETVYFLTKKLNSFDEVYYLDNLVKDIGKFSFEDPKTLIDKIINK